MKNLKFRIGRKLISKLYISFIRSTLEYASFFRDGCFAHDIENLEKVQLSAARIVTGLPSFKSRESLYTETGWQTLQNRHYTAKMVKISKITMVVPHLT